MQFTIQGHNVELSSPLRDYAIKKIGKLQEYYNNIQKIMVVLDVRHNDDLKRSHVAEVSIWASGKKVIHASECGENMYAAIDLVYDELKVQLKKHKDKHIKEVRRSAEKLKEISRQAPPLVAAAEFKHSIVKLKRFDIKIMSKDEAMAEQKMLGHDFYIFRNADNGELNVLHFDGIIDPGSVKVLSEDEAATEIKKANASFLPFLNPNTNEINVIYKRKSGNLGLIEPAL